MKVLVTGANGFLGSSLVDTLRDKGHDCVGCVRSVETEKGQIFFSLGETLPEELLRHLTEADALVHLAWTSTPASSNLDIEGEVRANVLGTISLFQAAARSGVSNIVFASSGGQVYGEMKGQAYAEDSPTHPKSAYGVGKLACEKFLEVISRQHGIVHHSLRISNLFGEGQKLKEGFGIIPTVINKILNDEPIDVFGTDPMVRDFVHVSDVVDSILLALFNPVGGAFNIGSGKGCEIVSLIDLIAELIGKPAIKNFQERRISDPRRVVLDIQMAMQRLAWQPKLSLEEGLQRTVDSYVRNTKS